MVFWLSLGSNCTTVKPCLPYVFDGAGMNSSAARCCHHAQPRSRYVLAPVQSALVLCVCDLSDQRCSKCSPRLPPSSIRSVMPASSQADRHANGYIASCSVRPTRAMICRCSLISIICAQCGGMANITARAHLCNRDHNACASSHCALPTAANASL